MLPNPSYVRGYTFKNVSDPQMWHGENTLTISDVQGPDSMPLCDAWPAMLLETNHMDRGTQDLHILQQLSEIQAKLSATTFAGTAYFQ
jgi:hypothetical protein